MSEIVDKVKGRMRETRAYAETTRARIAALEDKVATLEGELMESRQLNRRIAELTDVVVELLVPLQDRDEAKVNAALANYRASI